MTEKEWIVCGALLAAGVFALVYLFWVDYREAFRQ